MRKPRAIAALTVVVADEPAVDAFNHLVAGMTDAEARSQECEDRHHNAELSAHGIGVTYGLTCSGVDLSIDVVGGRAMLGGSYREGNKAGNIEAVTVADDATSYIWVRGAAYTTEQSTDATTLVFGTSSSSTSPPSASYEWLLLAKVVAAGGVATVTNYPHGQNWADWWGGRVVRAYNATGSQIDRGVCVYAAGVSDDTTNCEHGPSIDTAAGDTPASLPVVGLACTDIPATSWGFVLTAGYYPDHPDAAGFTAGDRLWCDTDGTVTPTQPNHAGAFVGVAEATGSGGVWVGPMESPGLMLGTAQESWSVGDGTNSDIYLYASNGDANRPGIRYQASGNKWQYSNDGSAWNDVGTGGGAGTPCDSVTAETSYGAASAAGVSAEYSRGDHTHGTPALSTANPVAIVPGTSAAPGSGTTPSKNDHVHAITCAAPTGTQHSTAAAEGSAASAARSDHTHLTFDTTDPENVSDTAADGSASTAARRDHVHEGVHSIAKAAGSQLVGDVTLSEGSNITLTVAGNNIAIAAAGAGTLATSVTAETTYGVASNAGSASTSSKGDHTHGTPKKPAKVFTWVAHTSDEDVLVGDGTVGLAVPVECNGWVVTAVSAAVDTAGITNTTDIQIRRRRGTASRSSADLLSTKITIDSGETGSATAATAAVINTSNDDLATDDLWYCDVDATSTTKAKGLTVTMTAEPA